MIRYALVTSRLDPVEAGRIVGVYLPDNYQVEAVLRTMPDKPGDVPLSVSTIVVKGEDSFGWTLDGYVLPRLASGGHYGTEIDLSHPVMKLVAS